jgi:predicted AlkP superfamily phosphohydrolase/phosphomutase
VLERYVPDDLIRAASEQVDFPNSRAYVRSRVECGVRINLEGREPDGVVPAEEYDEVREELVSLLSSARTPEDDPVFEDVALRGEDFEGPGGDAAVGVVTVPAGLDHFLSAGLSDEVFDGPDEPWNHKLEGIVAAAGEAVDPDVPLDGAHLFDVAPTVLATFDVPADERMDGSTLPVVGSSGERPYPRVERRRERTTGDRGVGRRVSGLG